MSETIKGLAHVGVICKDIEVSKKFYMDILGFELIHENTNTRPDGVVKMAFIRLKDIEIELVEMPVYEKRADGPVDHISMRVDNVDEAIAEFKAKGIQFLTEQPKAIPHLYDGRGVRFIFFNGPDGERLEFNEG